MLSHHHRDIHKGYSHTRKIFNLPGIYYKNAFFSHWVRCCIGDGCVRSTSFVICCVSKNLQLVQVNTIRMLSSLIEYDAVLVMVVCDPHHLSFVAWWIQKWACWYRYHLVHWSYGNVIGDSGFSSASFDALRPICLVPAVFDDEHFVDPYVVKLCSKTKSPVKGHMIGPHLIEVHSVTKSSDKGHIFGPHLVKVRSETKSSGKGHILGNICSKSAAWQSLLTRGTIWTTFGRSPLRDKVLQQGAQFGPHSVKVHSETMSSNEGRHFLPHLANVHCVTSSSDDWSWSSFSGHIWPKSAVWHILRRKAFFPCYAKFGQHQLLDMQLSSVIIHFLNAYSMSVTANTTDMASFPKRPDITGAPNQVFKFDNFLDHLIGGIKANTISVIGTIITELNTSALKSALTVLKTFFYQINLHQATMTAFKVMPGSVTAYTNNPWNNTPASGPRKDERNSPTDGASCLTSNTTSTPEQRNGGKRDPTTPIRTKTMLPAIRGKRILVAE